MTDLPLTFDRSAPGLATSLARQLRAAIRAGTLGAGRRLPPSRALAADLGVSRGVVVEAYERLTAEGLLIARTGAWTEVARVYGDGATPLGEPSPPARPSPSGRFDEGQRRWHGA